VGTELCKTDMDKRIDIIDLDLYKGIMEYSNTKLLN